MVLADVLKAILGVVDALQAVFKVAFINKVLRCKIEDALGTVLSFDVNARSAIFSTKLLVNHNLINVANRAGETAPPNELKTTVIF